MKRATTVATIALALAGCMSIPVLMPGAERVRYVSADEAKQCTFLQQVVYDTSYITTHGKSPGKFEQTGDVGIRNATAAIGGNAVFMISRESNWFVGTFNYQGAAYRCPA